MFNTTAFYVSGAVCGPIWWPAGAMCGRPLNYDIARGMSRNVDHGVSIRDTLLHVLMREGGDFQSASFTSDTVVRVERLSVKGGFRTVHVWEREIGQLADCADLVAADTYVSDFMTDDD